jgi:hypothetical protein
MKVKQLVWSVNQIVNPVTRVAWFAVVEGWQAVGADGCFEIYQHRLDNTYRCMFWFGNDGHYIDMNCKHPILDEAKAACQKHYERLILSGLETEDE